MIHTNSSRRWFLAAAGTAGAVAVAGCLDSGSAGEPADGDTETDEGLPAPKTPDVETIAGDPTDVPAPVDWQEPRRHEWTLETRELVAEVESGVTTRYMTYDGRIPGPLFRCRVGDTIHLTFDVAEDENVDVHNVDFHAVYGPGGGAVSTTAGPRDEAQEIEFTTIYPGVHIYHCAPGLHDQHISLGMFGAIIVEPEDGLPPVDREFFLGQHELYLEGENGEEGHHRFDADAIADENPTYVLFNGEAGRFTEGGDYGPLQAEVGETVRVFWCNGGPNLVSTPHPIGNVWTRWYRDGDVISDPARYVESATLGAGATAFGEMDMTVPGPIHLVDHALSPVVRKNFQATIEVVGESDPEIFNPDP